MFGKVLDGMDVVTAIEHTETDTRDRPRSDVVVTDAGVLRGAGASLVSKGGNSGAGGASPSSWEGRLYGKEAAQA